MYNFLLSKSDNLSFYYISKKTNFQTILQVLNVGLSYFILKVAYQAMFVSGSITNDARSNNLSSDENDDVDKETTKKMQ